MEIKYVPLYIFKLDAKVMEFFHIYYEKSQIRRTGAALVQFLAEGRFFLPFSHIPR